MADKSLPDLYRDHAAKERAVAEASPLPSVRALHERAAGKWDELANCALLGATGRK